MMEPGLSYIHIFPAVITGSLKDIPGFCTSAGVENVNKPGNVLNIRLNDSTSDEEDDLDFIEWFFT